MKKKTLIIYTTNSEAYAYEIADTKKAVDKAFKQFFYLGYEPKDIKLIRYMD